MSDHREDASFVLPSNDKKIGYRGFHLLLKQMTLEQPELPFTYQLSTYGSRASRIMSRRCSKLTHRQALTVIKAVAQGSAHFIPVDSNDPTKRSIQRQLALLQLTFETNIMVAMAPAACAFDPWENTPSSEMATISAHSRGRLTMWQAFKESVCGLPTQQANKMCGDIISYLNDDVISESEREWFGANWRNVLPLWETLLESGSVSRSRFEAMRDKTFSEVPTVLMDGAL
jgi:hypothetical protein